MNKFSNETNKNLSQEDISLVIRYAEFIKKIKEVRDNLAYMGAEYGVDEAVFDLNKILRDEEE